LIHNVGALAGKTAFEAAEGKTVPKQVLSPLILVDKSNVSQFTADQRKLP
jgi:ABC-type sugar transport system substrate-binding protein